jgi:hypothetical protein
MVLFKTIQNNRFGCLKAGAFKNRISYCKTGPLIIVDFNMQFVILPES